MFKLEDQESDSKAKDSLTKKNRLTIITATTLVTIVGTIGVSIILLLMTGPQIGSVFSAVTKGLGGYSSSSSSSASKPDSGGVAASPVVIKGLGGSSSNPTVDTNSIPGDAPTIATNQLPIDQSSLKAGLVDDNLKYEDYLRYINTYTSKAALPFDVTERYIVQVQDNNAHTIANASVKIYVDQDQIFEGKTYSSGQLLFFPNAIAKTKQAKEFRVEVVKNGANVSQIFKRTDPEQSQNQNSGTKWTIIMNGSANAQSKPTPSLDLLFLIDSTGSMGGEISKIQQTIGDIANQINQLPGSPKIRFGVVTYRDRGDTYVTRKFGFTSDLAEFSNFLNSIVASAGGDYPESLNEALHVAIDDMDWNSTDAVRLAFLVADAPPHLDYANDYKYTDEVVNAVQKGIKVYTIGASGLDKQGEYIFRQIAQITLAQYLFITRGGDEQKGGSSNPASKTGIIYQEKDLSSLVVNIVRRELTNLDQ
jgi:hypothetical protein